MKTILFPTDLSDAANKAYVYALQLAKNLGASLTTLHVYHKPEVRGATHIPSSLEEFYKEYDLHEFASYKGNIPLLDQIAEANHLADVPVTHMLERGEVVPTILRVAAAEGAELIVMGTTGARGLKEIFLGSVAGEVLEKAGCPVLTVPEKSEFDGRIDHIAYAIDLQTDHHEPAMAVLLSLANAFDAELHCVHIDLAHIEFHVHRMDALRVAYAHQPRVHFHVVEATDFMGGIASFLDTHHIDLLAMVTRQRTFLQELFNYSRTKAMTYHSKYPVLSFTTAMLE